MVSGLQCTPGSWSWVVTDTDLTLDINIAETVTRHHDHHQHCSGPVSLTASSSSSSSDTDAVISALIKLFKSSFFIQSQDQILKIFGSQYYFIVEAKHRQSQHHCIVKYLKMIWSWWSVTGIEWLLPRVQSVTVAIIIITIQSTSEYHHLTSSLSRYLCRFYLHHHLQARLLPWDSWKWLMKTYHWHHIAFILKKIP